MFCDYDTSRGFCPTEGLGCFKGIATYKVLITYNEVESDTLHLCQSCHDQLKSLVRKQYYKFASERIR